MQTLTVEIPWITRGCVAGALLLVTDTAGQEGCTQAGLTAHHQLQQRLQLLLPARQRDSSTNTDRGSNLAYLGLERSPGDKLCAAMISHAGSAQI